jgi:hypothetical protein
MSHIQSKIGLLSSLYTSQVVPVGFFYLTLPVFLRQEAVGLLQKPQDIQVLCCRCGERAIQHCSHCQY